MSRLLGSVICICTYIIRFNLRSRSTFCISFRISEEKYLLLLVSWTDIELRDNKEHAKVLYYFISYVEIQTFIEITYFTG